MVDTIKNPHRLYEGYVTHQRFMPKIHRFKYKLFYLYLDLDELDSIDNVSRFWSKEKLNFVSYRRSDYFPYFKDSPLKESIISYIKEQTGNSFEGKIYVLTNLRYWGFCFNPVSYYFCFNQNDQLVYILDHVTNTPWGESHVYLHQPHHLLTNNSQLNNISSIKVNSQSDKQFHVSPFMPMNLLYKTRYQLSATKLLIHMDLSENNKKNDRLFFATMNMQGQELSMHLATKLPFIYPMQCGKIIFGIYWQALKLWIKKVPYIRHP